MHILFLSVTKCYHHGTISRKSVDLQSLGMGLFEVNLTELKIINITRNL